MNKDLQDVNFRTQIAEELSRTELIDRLCEYHETIINLTTPKIKAMKKFKLIKDYPFNVWPVGHTIENGSDEIKRWPEYWQEVKEIKVRIDKFKTLEENVNWVGKPELIKNFETKEAAEQWIKENKPRFSEKQVLDAIHKATSGTNNLVASKSHIKKELGL